MYEGNKVASYGAALGAGTGIVSQAPKLARDRGALDISADGISSSLDILHGALDRLADQLAPLMLPEPSMGVAGNDAPTPIASPVVGYLQNLRRRVDSLTSRVESIANRLEV